MVFGVDDLCAVISHFDDLVIVELAQDDGVGKLLAGPHS